MTTVHPIGLGAREEREVAFTYYPCLPANSTRHPAEKVSNEVSVLVTGYVFKPNSEAGVAVGGANFPMYTQNDGAWVKNAAEEAKLLDTMRKGADVVIKATTSRGTQTTDTFSLKGIGQALCGEI